MQPWVVDPRVERFGMIYDISDFSQTLSMLHREGNERQDDAFLAMFRFQRRINRLAVSHRAKLEKYLGDGAFYSSREATNLLLCSIYLQRYYVEAVREGLPFDRGMRIALNFGPYRLIPMGSRPEEGERYEFFGPGLVELSRLTTGKATQEVDEVKTMLISQGLPRGDGAQVLLASLLEERRRGGQGRGAASLLRLHQPQRHPAQQRHGGDRRLHRASRKGARTLPALPRQTRPYRSYIFLALEDAGEKLSLGFRKLGMAHLKGLEKLAVYEIVDGVELNPSALKRVYGATLATAIERDAGGDGWI